MWLHRLLHPHCAECNLEKECRNCDVLRQLLEVEKFENKQLLERLLHVPEVERKVNEEVFKPIHTSPISLRVRREMLENEDRVKARLMKEKEEEMKSIDVLENELLKKEDTSS